MRKFLIMKLIEDCNNLDFGEVFDRKMSKLTNQYNLIQIELSLLKSQSLDGLLNQCLRQIRQGKVQIRIFYKKIFLDHGT